MKKLYIIPILILLLAGAMGVNAQSDAHRKLRMAEMAINQFYVDTVNENRIVEEAIRGMLRSLDPHSQYTSAQETRAFQEQLNGNFSGIGISFNMTGDTVRVISTVSGGPSERVGILAGDRIVAVNDTIIAGKKMDTSDVMKRLRGPKGSMVNVKVLRPSGSGFDAIDFRIKRDEIPIYSVDAAYMIDDKTGFIRINKFGAETAKEMAQALRNLKKQGMTQLILDLVDNTGGYLNAAVDILGELLEPGSRTVYTEGRQSPRTDNYSAPAGREPLFNKGRLVVMANQYSASAAEITAGAIQDWDRGLIVGRRTFGKGLVQRPVPFPDGSMMRLTVAHYYTPSGRDIQKPYNKGNSNAYNLDILDRFNHGELMHEDSVKHDDSLRVQTLRLHRPIYGGGGIYPDKFVALDTTDNSRYYRDVMAKGTILKFANGYVDANRKKIRKQYKTDMDYLRGFKVTDQMLSELWKMAENDGVKLNEEEAQRSKPLFSMVLKALIGRDIYDQATYFKAYNEYDPIFREAYRLINSAEYDELMSPQ